MYITQFLTKLGYVSQIMHIVNNKITNGKCPCSRVDMIIILRFKKKVQTG